MSNKFCRLLSNGYKINVEGQNLLWSPCCFYSKKTPLLDTVKFKQELDYTSSATDWLPECATCRQMESTGVVGLAPRLGSFRKVPEDVDNGVCVALELSFDRKCNAACLSCGSYCSTTWSKYEFKHQLINYKTDNNPADKLLNQLVSAVPMDQLREVFILGGEPLYSDLNVQFLQHLNAVHPDLTKVRLYYQSNGSIFPSAEVLSLISKFGRIDFGLSIDGIGERFNYLRWPLKWNRVEQNVRKLLEISNAKFYVNATVSPLNLLYIDEIINWYDSTIPVERRIWPDRSIRVNRSTGKLDLNCSSNELKAQAVDHYGNDHVISHVLSGINELGNYRQMFDYIETHDVIRKLDWRKTFPEVAQYYTRL